MIECVLGQGSFGTAYRVRDASTLGLFALKVIARQNSNAIMSPSDEIKTLCSLDHPNVIKLIAAEVEADQSGVHESILMEYCPGKLESPPTRLQLVSSPT